ncbi:MAG: hypothetical protein RJB38_1791 [Pseudomonadota bacterium]|jgi:pSer/pThr/pTyr-binding forkhead associated (FHA) protein
MARAGATAIKLRNLKAPRQRGELARLRVLKGPDRGVAYVLTNTRASIGRGDENDITIGDLKASRLHAEISASAQGWLVRDLGSANGILHNGTQCREALVRLSDLVTVGETVLEFIPGNAPDAVLLAPPRDETQVNAVISGKPVAKAQARSLSDPFGFQSGSQPPQGAAAASTGSKKAIRLGLAAAAALVVVFASEFVSNSPQGQKKERKPSKEGQPSDLASLLPKLDKAPVSRNAEMFFKQGFREYRERNYIRALNQFDLVLQLVPDHEGARRYRENARIEIEEEVKQHLERGRKAFSTGRLREARGHYEAVLRLLNSDQANPSYQEAKDLLTEVQSELEAG